MPSPYTKFFESFWTGELAQKIRGDTDAMALACYLMTCPHRNRIGCYRIGTATMCEDLGIDSRRASEGLRKLSETGFLVYDKHYRMALILEYARHQYDPEPKISDNQIKSLIAALPHMLHICSKSLVWQAFHDRYGKPWAAIFDSISSPSEALPKPFRRARGRIPDSGAVTVTVTREVEIEREEQEPRAGQGKGKKGKSAAKPAAVGGAFSLEVKSVFDAHDFGIQELARQTGRDIRKRTRSALHGRLIEQAFEDYAAADIGGPATVRLAVRNLVLSPHHRGENPAGVNHLDLNLALVGSNGTKKAEHYAGMCWGSNDEFCKVLAEKLLLAKSNGKSGRAPKHESYSPFGGVEGGGKRGHIIEE